MTRRIKLLLAVLACHAGMAAFAQGHPRPQSAAAGEIFKCLKDGKITYTNERCETGSKKQEVDLQPTEGFAPPPRDVVKKTMNELRTEHERESSPGAQVRSIEAAPAPRYETGTEIRIDQYDPYYDPYRYPAYPAYPAAGPAPVDPCRWASRHPETNTKTVGCGPATVQRPATRLQTPPRPVSPGQAPAGRQAVPAARLKAD